MHKRITKPYHHKIKLSKSGLVAISISARCRSKKQIKRKKDEDLRVEINGLNFREIPPKKNIQLYNIPPAFNGSKLKGLKKTVIFLTVLNKGWNIVSLIPKNSAFIEDVTKPIKPHDNPETNDFGSGVKNNYIKVEKLLGL